MDLRLGDCLEILPTLPDKSVDAIITDLPYGTTACKWDVIIPFEPMWEQVKRVCKGVFVTTVMQPFTSVLTVSNLSWFREEWIWDKVRVTGAANAKKKPLKSHENIIVFSQNGHTYNPQLTGIGKRPFGKISASKASNTSAGMPAERNFSVGYPKSILSHMRPNNLTEGYLHPTQKPVALYEYLIRTYTNEGDTVLDFCMGSGTTGVACVNTGREFIGIEKEADYYEIAQRRIQEAQQQLVMEFI